MQQYLDDPYDGICRGIVTDDSIDVLLWATQVHNENVLRRRKDEFRFADTLCEVRSKRLLFFFIFVMFEMQ